MANLITGNAPPPESTEYDETWRRFKKGEEKAFAEIYQTYFKALCNYGNRLTSDRSALEDAIHDAFIDLWRRREFLTDVKNVKFYLFKALRNQVHRSTKSDFLNKSESIDNFLDYLNLIASEESQTDNDYTQKINLAVSRLSPRQQEVINLRFFHGMGLSETAELMGLSKQSVSNLLFKSYAVLRLALKALSSLLFFFSGY